MKRDCFTASIRNGRLYLKNKNVKKCQRQGKDAETLIKSIKSRKIIIR